MSALAAPFPWFGGKRRAAAIIWDALGDPAGYVDLWLSPACLGHEQTDLFDMEGEVS